MIDCGLAAVDTTQCPMQVDYIGLPQQTIIQAAIQIGNLPQTVDITTDTLCKQLQLLMSSAVFLYFNTNLLLCPTSTCLLALDVLMLVTQAVCLAKTGFQVTVCIIGLLARQVRSIPNLGGWQASVLACSGQRCA